MIELSKFPTVKQANLYLGASYTGKTESLLSAIASLLHNSVDASKMLVFCATPVAAQRFKVRLLDLCADAGEATVTTPRAFFLDLLDSEEACLATGRKARLLLPFEYDFFLEDMKTSNIRPHRLREILKFLCRGLTELADDEEGWLITSEEDDLLSHMRDCLSFTGAVLEPELANLAVKYLRGNDAIRGTAGKAHVFVDDFQLLSRASQVAACLLAKESLCLSADREVTTEVYESYPHLGGVDEFIEAHPHAGIAHLIASHSCCAAARASLALREENGIGVLGAGHPSARGRGRVRIIEGEYPRDEIAEVCDAIKQLLQNGLAVSDIAVAAPHHAWRKSIARQLEARGVPAETLPDARCFREDARRREKCPAARFLTALSLVADPDDAVAWRSWCGFGDYLTNSSGIHSLRKRRQPRAKTLGEALLRDGLQENRSSGAGVNLSTKRIMKAREEAHALIDRLEGLSGRGLLEAIAEELSVPNARVPEEVRGLLAGREGDLEGLEGMSAASMISQIRSLLEFPVYRRHDAVRVASYDNLVGMDPKCLVLAGFLNGFFPKSDYFDGTELTVEKRGRRYAQDLGRISSVVAKASDALLVSYCRKLDLEDAELLHLVIERVVFENRRRVARTQPSIFLGFIDDRRPPEKGVRDGIRS